MEATQKQKVSMISLGCPKNLVDAEVMLGVLSKQEYEITTNEKDADVIIVNKIDTAKQADTKARANISTTCLFTIPRRIVSAGRMRCPSTTMRRWL